LKKKFLLRLILLLSVILAIYFFSRIAFFFFNRSYFSDISFNNLIYIFIAGIRFDLSAIFALNILIIFLLYIPLKQIFHKNYLAFVKSLFVLINSVAILFNAIDFVYFKFINTRTSAEIFKYTTLSSDVLMLLPQFLKDFWYVPLLWLLMGWFLWFLFSKLISRNFFLKQRPIVKNDYFKLMLLILIWLFSSVIFIRGGFQLRPLSIASAATYAQSKYVPLVLNTPFNIIKTVGKEHIKYNVYFNDENEKLQYFNPLKQPINNVNTFKNYNVIIFILEGFSREHIGSLNTFLEEGNYKGYTPFLDSIVKNAMVFENAYANGKRTIDATPAVLASIPNLMNTAFVISPYSGNQINSIASLLKPKGYSSYFFHGGTNGTMAFDNFAALSGFDSYFGRNEYNNDEDFDGKWGIYDEPFLQRMAQELNKSHKPFVSTVFTLSSHHPYTVPEKYKNLFSKGTMDIHASICYADYALRKFFETASKMDWFENTLFVFTADHTTEARFDYYKTKRGMYNIPIIFYAPQIIRKELSRKVAQHTDIMPTILDILGYDKPYIAFGNSLIDKNQKSFSVNYCDGIYQIITDKYLMMFDGSSTLSMYDIKNDILLQENIVNTIKEEERILLENLLKSYIQSYHFRIVNNKLIAI